MNLFAGGRRLDTAPPRQKKDRSSIVGTHKTSRRDRQRHEFARFVLGLAAVLGWSTGSLVPASATSVPSAPLGWQTTWTSPTDDAAGLTYNSTIRDIATVAVAGNAVQLTFSNLWSSTATTFADVTVGVQQIGANVVPGSLIPVTFRGSRFVTIGPHARVTSDPVVMRVTAGESLAVSIAVSGPATVSAHYCCYGHDDSYATSNGAGNLSAVPAGTGFSAQIPRAPL